MRGEKPVEMTVTTGTMPQAIPGGMDMSMPGNPLMEAQARREQEAYMKGYQAGVRDSGSYAEQLTKAARAFCETYRREWHSAQSEAEQWPKWVDGFNTDEPIDAAYLALVAALSMKSSGDSDTKTIKRASCIERGHPHLVVRAGGEPCMICGEATGPLSTLSPAKVDNVAADGCQSDAELNGVGNDTCPACEGPATRGFQPDTVEYGIPSVSIPYVCPIIVCAKCGVFSGADGEDARAAVIAAWKSGNSQVNSEKP